MKLITFAVPCYNSAAYMRRCIETLLPAGDEAEIIIVNDGSKDNTGEIADEYAAKYPDIVRAVHQENGGHGEAVNAGLRNATGFYYKVVDSDDWLDVPCLTKVLQTLKNLREADTPPDMMIANYVYEHIFDNTRRPMNYRNVFPLNRIFGWDDIHPFMPWQYLLMHSVIYRTQLLRDCNFDLPKHTFYVDNIFVFQPLPHVEKMYYMDLDLYRYFIGRDDQSVNESIMIKRVDQQLRVTRIMIKSHRLPGTISSKKLYRYMLSYLSMMMTISSVLLLIPGTDENIRKKEELWEFVRDYDPALYRRLRYHFLGTVTCLPGRAGQKFTVRLYRIARNIYKFN